MAFSLAIDTSNAAFDTTPRAELARILRAAADGIESGREDEGACRCSTGKPVGIWRIVGIGE